MAKRNVLVLGSGGREYALCVALEKSPSVGSIIVAPGNSAMGARWSCEDLKPSDRNELISLVLRRKIDLVVVGPEARLVEGVVDTMIEHNVPAFGPTAYAAKLEGSKVFMKRFAKELGIPSASFEVFTTPSAARAYVRKLAVPPVIKADGLCAGKGVVVSDDTASALAAVDAILERRAFGPAGAAIVIEERIAGQEVSVQALCDGERYMLLPAAQDHKRVGDNDSGPNTGGMGTYAPAPILTPALEARVRREIIEPTLRGMREQGHPFRGVLFAGIMVTPQGDPLLLEFNVRFGDPEAQVTLPLVDGDFADACYACATGSLREDQLKVRPLHAVCVVLAARGYPGTVEVGEPIAGLDKVKQSDDLMVYHAGTRYLGDRYVTASGRVLNVVATGQTLVAAREKAYAACGAISFDGMHYRRDIGARALGL